MKIFQKPNLPIITAAVSFILYNVAPTPLDSILLIVFIIAMSVWSYGEAFHGINWFRRWLGIIGFAVAGIAFIALIT